MVLQVRSEIILAKRPEKIQAEFFVVALNSFINLNLEDDQCLLIENCLSYIFLYSYLGE